MDTRLNRLEQLVGPVNGRDEFKLALGLLSQRQLTWVLAAPAARTIDWIFEVVYKE